VERPLVNEYLFGEHGLQDTGAQATYTPATPWYTRFGVELLQGADNRLDRFGLSGGDSPVERDSGPRVVTLFAKTGPDLGADHALQLGASAGHIGQYARLEGHGDHAHAFEGDGWFAGLDAAYRYDAGQSYGKGDWRINAEYFRVERDLDEYVEHHHDGHGHWERRGAHSERQDGAYLEVVHGIAQRWEIGARAEALGLTNERIGTHPTGVKSLDTSYRYSAQATYRPLEPVFVRGQISYEDFASAGHDDHDHGHHGGSGSGSGLAFYLQVNIALGAHGAHRF